MKSTSFALTIGLFLSVASTASAWESTNLIVNPTFAGGTTPTNWVSNQGWQVCAGASGSSPCVTTDNKVTFSYIPNTTISQSGITIPNSTGVRSSLTFSIDHEPGWFSDATQITLDLYDASNTLLASQSAVCNQPCTDPLMTVSITDNAALAAADHATVTFIDTSGNGWAGNYGAIFHSPQLILSGGFIVPTSSNWALGLLAILMALAAAFFLSREQHLNKT